MSAGLCVCEFCSHVFSGHVVGSLCRHGAAIRQSRMCGVLFPSKWFSSITASAAGPTRAGELPEFGRLARVR